MQINFTLDTLDVSAEDVRLIESISRQLAIQVASRVATGYVAAEAMMSGTPVVIEDLGYPTETKPVKVRKSKSKTAEEIAEGAVEKELEAAYKEAQEAEYQEAQEERQEALERQQAEYQEAQEAEYQADLERQEAAYQATLAKAEASQSAYTYKGKSLPFAKFLELYKSGEAKFEDFTFGKAPEGTDFKAISDLYRPKSTVAGNGAKYRAFLNWLGGLQSAKEAKQEVYLPILDFLTSL